MPTAVNYVFIRVAYKGDDKIRRAIAHFYLWYGSPALIVKALYICSVNIRRKS